MSSIVLRIRPVRQITNGLKKSKYPGLAELNRTESEYSWSFLLSSVLVCFWAIVPERITEIKWLVWNLGWSVEEMFQEKTVNLPRYIAYVPDNMIYIHNYTYTLFNYKAIIREASQFSYLYINLACLSVCLFVCLFLSNKRQNGWTDRAQIFCGISLDPREGLWMINLSKICLHQNSIFEMKCRGEFVNWNST